MKKLTSHPTLALIPPLVRFICTVQTPYQHTLRTIADNRGCNDLLSNQGATMPSVAYYFKSVHRFIAMLLINLPPFHLCVLYCPAIFFLLSWALCRAQHSPSQSSCVSTFATPSSLNTPFFVSAISLIATTLLRRLCAGHSYNSLHFCVINEK